MISRGSDLGSSRPNHLLNILRKLFTCRHQSLRALLIMMFVHGVSPPFFLVSVLVRCVKGGPLDYAASVPLHL